MEEKGLNALWAYCWEDKVREWVPKLCPIPRAGHGVSLGSRVFAALVGMGAKNNGFVVEPHSSWS